jgi:hypothetical protein
MTKIRPAILNIAATTTDVLLDTLTCPKGHTFQCKEIGFGLTTDGQVRVFLEDEQLVTYNFDADDDRRRVVIDWELKEGMELRVYGDNNNAGAQDVGYTLVYDDVSG